MADKGKVFLKKLFLCFIAWGLFFFLLLGSSWIGVVKTWFMLTVTCTFFSSLIVGDDVTDFVKKVKKDFKEVFSDLLTGYKFRKHLSGTKTVIEQLVGIAIESLFAEAGLQVIDNAKGKLSPEVLKHFQENLQSLSSEKSFIDLTGEKFNFYEHTRGSNIFNDDTCEYYFSGNAFCRS